MNVPLFWLAEYVILPDDVQELTDRLTMIGHMLDKTLEVEGQKIIDLELRGNRADLFGLIGIARDISAAWDVPLQLPKTASLPVADKKSKLITVEATDIVPRFTAFTVTVTVGPSPSWLVNKLTAYGMASINNVVDITNYIMIETGIPIHAFDKQKLSGGRLIIRRAKKNEQMTTFMGGTISLNSEDIVLADEKAPQAITLVGSKYSGTTQETKEILIEAAVYNQANVRRTSRRLGVRTEAGTRLEKHLDPNDVPFALSRALYLLQELAGGNITSSLTDVYPTIRKPITINLPSSEVERLSGITVPQKQQKKILERLGCLVKEQKNTNVVTVPTFRTDITEEADLVEEITRIAGYETVPTLILDGELPPEQTTERVKQESTLKRTLVNLQLNEVITSTFIPNTFVNSYAANGTFSQPALLTNAPDPAISTLRPSLIPNLAEYAKRSLHERAERVALFEIGKVYWKTQEKKKDTYQEERRLGIIISGTTDTKSYAKTPRALTFFDIKGIVEMVSELTGIPYILQSTQKTFHPSFAKDEQLVILNTSLSKIIGYIGKLDATIQKNLGVPEELFAAEFSLDVLIHDQPTLTAQYILAPQYPPVIEDISFTVDSTSTVGPILLAMSSFHPLIAAVKLLDAYQNKRTFRITYQDSKKNLSGEEIKPIREQLIENISKKFQVTLVA